MINAPRSGAYDNGFQVVHMGYGVDEKVQVPQKLYEAGVPTVLVGKVADIVNNPYGVSWQNLVDSQRIMDITLNEFNTYPTAFICTNIQETDLAGHEEDVARYAERLQVVDRNLARLVEAMQPDDCLVVMADHGNDPTIGHSHHTREVVPVLVYQQGLVATQLGVDPTPFFVVICMAASASFSTPIGYQTNLIVQGIGSYKFTDFVKIGLPLNLITFLISVFVIPMIWKF